MDNSVATRRLWTTICHPQHDAEGCRPPGSAAPGQRRRHPREPVPACAAPPSPRHLRVIARPPPPRHRPPATSASSPARHLRVIARPPPPRHRPPATSASSPARHLRVIARPPPPRHRPPATSASSPGRHRPSPACRLTAAWPALWRAARGPPFLCRLIPSARSCPVSLAGGPDGLWCPDAPPGARARHGNRGTARSARRLPVAHGAGDAGRTGRAPVTCPAVQGRDLSGRIWPSRRIGYLPGARILLVSPILRVISGVLGREGRGREGAGGEVPDVTGAAAAA